MLPTLAERLREQHAKSRGRRPSRPPWPVPGEPPTALLFLVREVVVTEIARPEVLEPMVTEPELKLPETLEPPMTLPDLAAALPVRPRQGRERTPLAELLLLLVWSVLVVIDGALALASLIDGAAGRQRRAPASAACDPSPSAAPPFLMAAAAP